jgi:hypothetical protein
MTVDMTLNYIAIYMIIIHLLLKISQIVEDLVHLDLFRELHLDTKRRVRVMAFNVTFNNISVISILLVEETGVPGENH